MAVEPTVVGCAWVTGAVTVDIAVGDGATTVAMTVPGAAGVRRLGLVAVMALVAALAETTVAVCVGVAAPVAVDVADGGGVAVAELAFVAVTVGVGDGSWVGISERMLVALAVGVAEGSRETVGMLVAFGTGALVAV